MKCPELTRLLSDDGVMPVKSLAEGCIWLAGPGCCIIAADAESVSLISHTVEPPVVAAFRLPCWFLDWRSEATPRCGFEARQKG